MEVLSRLERVKFAFLGGGRLVLFPTVFYGQWQHLNFALIDIGLCFEEKRSNFVLQIAHVGGNSLLGG